MKSAACSRFLPILSSISLIALVARGEDAGIQKLEAQATLGDPEAEFLLGFAYTRGEGLPKDDGKAVEWYLKSAAQGNANAE